MRPSVFYVLALTLILTLAFHLLGCIWAVALGKVYMNFDFSTFFFAFELGNCTTRTDRRTGKTRNAVYTIIVKHDVE